MCNNKNDSAVTETVPELETAVFRRNCGEPKPRFFGAKWIRFRLPTFVFIYGTKPTSWFRRGDWRYLPSLQRPLNLPIQYLSSYAHALECIVSASNHCEVDQQRQLTRHLLNSIICLAKRRRPWINGRGVCSNSIEYSTNTNRKFALAWQLVFDVPFHWRCTSTQFAFQPAARCDRRPSAPACHYDENKHHVSKDCFICSKVPRDLRRYTNMYWRRRRPMSEWARWAIWKLNSKISSII